MVRETIPTGIKGKKKYIYIYHNRIYQDENIILNLEDRCVISDREQKDFLKIAPNIEKSIQQLLDTNKNNIKLI